jgi:hypothetical protein
VYDNGHGCVAACFNAICTRYEFAFDDRCPERQKTGAFHVLDSSSALPSAHLRIMAFTIPAHPTRKADVSTEILTKISEAGPKALRASLARDWVGELENAIRQTKVSTTSSCPQSPDRSTDEHNSRLRYMTAFTKTFLPSSRTSNLASPCRHVSAR